MYRNIRIGVWSFLLFGLTWMTCSMSMTQAAQIKPVVAISVGGYDAIWKAVDRIADRMGYKQNVVGFRSVLADVQGLDKTKPGGIVVLTNGKDLFPFGFLPVKKIDDLMFMGVESLRQSIEEVDGVKFFRAQNAQGKTDIELLERDGWLFFFEKGKSKCLPDGDPTRFLSGLDQHYFLGLKCWFENMSPDLLDSVFSLVRQRLAVSQTQTMAQWKMLRKVGDTFIESAQTSTCGVKTNATGSLLIESGTALKSGSELANIYRDGVQEESAWAHLYQPSGAAFSAIVSARQPKNNQKFQKENVRETFNNMLSSMEISLDEEDMTKTKKIIAPLMELITATVSQEKLDGAMTITVDPLVVFGQTVVDGEKFTQFLKLLDKEALTDAPLKGHLKIDAEKIGTYSLSSFALPFAELKKKADERIPPILANRDLAIYCATGNDALIIVFGLDQKAAYEKIKSLASNAERKEKTLPQNYYLSCQGIGQLLKNLKLQDLPEMKGYATVFDILAKADSKATLYGKTNPAKNLVVTEEFGIDGNTFAVVGDIIRACISLSDKSKSDGKKKTNDLKDADSLFDN